MPLRLRPHARPVISYLMIASCCAVFLLDSLGLISFRGGEMYYIDAPQYSPSQLLSHLFLHGGWAHLLLNMLGLLIFGTAIERVIGSFRFLVFYLVSGIGAGVIYQWVSVLQFNQLVAPLLQAGITSGEIQQVFSSLRYFAQFPESEQASLIFASPVVGASGALYGLLAGFMCLFPNRKMIFLFLPFPIAAKFFVPAIVMIDVAALVFGFSLFGENIAHAAHIGGAVSGLMVMLIILLFQLRKHHSR